VRWEELTAQLLLQVQAYFFSICELFMKKLAFGDYDE